MDFLTAMEIFFLQYDFKNLTKMNQYIKTAKFLRKPTCINATKIYSFQRKSIKIAQVSMETQG